MDMEDHPLQQQHQWYGMPDFRQLMIGARSAHYQTVQPSQPTSDHFSTHHSLNPNNHHHQHQRQLEMLMFRPQVADVMPAVLHDFASDSISTPTTVAAAVVSNNKASNPSLNAIETESAGGLGGDASTGRWPRQETLTLLEIRSRLDPKFKEANQKGPLWDEVSRIMSEEHGYQRSGKKCREKFENLYKYYKKTKEGKAGRQDGKNYRFFRQLEALYGESSNHPTSGLDSNFVGGSFSFQAAIGQTSTKSTQENFPPPMKLCDSLTLTNSTEFDTSSSDVNGLSNGALLENDSLEKQRNRSSFRRGWKAKIKDFVDSQMNKLMEKQEAWLERLTKILEQKERESVLREEVWRKQEAARLEREHKFWARERAWIEARDAAMMEALQKLTGREIKGNSPDHVELMDTEIQNHSENQNEDGSEILNSNVKFSDQSWSDSEITRLIQLRSEMEHRFQQCCVSEQNLWEEVATKMACSIYEQRSALTYKEKWESIQNCNQQNFKKEGNKKCKEKARNCYYENINQSSLYNQGSSYCDVNDGERQETTKLRADIDDCSPSNSNAENAGNAVSDSCFRFFMTEGESLWENYGMKLNKLGNQNQ